MVVLRLQNGTEGYNEYVDAPYVWEVSENTGNHYLMGIRYGNVCWYYGVDPQTLEACRSDFAWQATELEAGGEVATESKPTFGASTNNSAEWTTAHGIRGTSQRWKLRHLGYARHPSTGHRATYTTTPPVEGMER